MSRIRPSRGIEGDRVGSARLLLVIAALFGAGCHAAGLDLVDGNADSFSASHVPTVDVPHPSANPGANPGTKPETAASPSKEATASTSRAAQADETLVAQNLNRGHREAALNHPRRAEIYYRRVLELQPDNAVAHHRLAVLADKRHDYRAAEEHYLAALRSDPNNANLLSDLGYSYLLQGRNAESERYLQKAVAVDPLHNKALHNLSLLYAKQGDYDRSFDALRRAVGESEARVKIAQLFPHGREGNPGQKAVVASFEPSTPTERTPSSDDQGRLAPLPPNQRGLGGSDPLETAKAQPSQKPLDEALPDVAERDAPEHMPSPPNRNSSEAHSPGAMDQAANGAWDDAARSERAPQIARTAASSPDAPSSPSETDDAPVFRDATMTDLVQRAQQIAGGQAAPSRGLAVAPAADRADGYAPAARDRELDRADDDRLPDNRVAKNRGPENRNPYNRIPDNQINEIFTAIDRQGTNAPRDRAERAQAFAESAGQSVREATRTAASGQFSDVGSPPSTVSQVSGFEETSPSAQPVRLSFGEGADLRAAPNSNPLNSMPLWPSPAAQNGADRTSAAATGGAALPPASSWDEPPAKSPRITATQIAPTVPSAPHDQSDSDVGYALPSWPESK